MILKKNVNNYLLIYLISHLLIWTLIPSVVNTNLPLDTIEALAWGSDLKWGFEKHPPMSGLMVEIIFQLFGNNDWAYYLLSQIFLTFTFFIVWKFSNEIFKDKTLSLISVLMLSGFFFYNYTTPEFNVNICQLPFWALTVLYGWRSFNVKDKISNWLFFGLFASFGFLSKYLFIFLLIGIKIFYLYFLIKKKKINIYYFIPGLIFLAVISPHLIWLSQNDYVTILYGLSRSNIETGNFINHLINPLIFLIKQIIILVPIMLMTYVLLKKIKIDINSNNTLIYLVCINILPFILMLLYSLLTGAKIRTMWMTPFYIFFPTMLLFIFKKFIFFKNLKKFFLIFFIFFLISPLTYLAVSILDKNKRTDYPGREIADLVQRKWDKNFSNEITIVVGDEWAAGNLSYHLVSRPKWLRSLKTISKDLDENQGVIYAGNPDILKKICPGEFGTIRPTGYCMIGRR
tara:strand:- start:2269 stop:3642 length:1374 start_codon:yes stop_codon:yes gene_type:complete